MSEFRISIRLLILFTAIAAGISATRADDLSDLVAAVAADSKPLHRTGDGLILTFDSLPEYVPSKKREIDSSFLEGIYQAMAVSSTLDYILNAYDATEDSRRETRRLAMEYERRAARPTLGMHGFFRPVPGTITSMYGWRPQFGRLHHGIDLHLNVGDTVRAALSGTVERIGYDPHGYGNYLILTHPDGLSTLYGHLSYALAGQGQEVYAGAPIAIGGNTGNSTGPHLHFEVRRGDMAIDPTLIFDFYGRAQMAGTEEDDTPPPGVDPRKSLTGKRTYVVRQGDTPKSIAKRAGISVARLCQLNMIKESAPLQPGRMLKIK